ncbi:Pimeloyl-ACP methyl ester carboxylesterase [Jannaschia faecimaris]|uniref:Pimeloyl-ACP methyl ester carboxylesterase n=1 Tax=Jannaschia faecimaris TaxID=1244108 RepID=A0A1H3MY56_9RHOB|nr:alpha/beta hydrolase [Jannaschia faecimaris]SDY81458.1 Pimeloyl-ACP methyl ester carboxylesterase [Jannaschia faecimaris]
MPEFKSSDNLRLWYEDQGDPDDPPILCLSGLTRNSTDFDYVLPYLLSEHRVIRLDYRGRGKSQRSPDWRTYTIPTEARDVIELLDHLGFARVSIIGTSRGGLIAMALALMAKDRLSGVCLVDIGPELSPEGLDVIRDYIGKNPSARNLEEAALMRATMLKGFANVPAERWRAEVEKHYRETEDGLVITYDAKLRDAVLEAGEQPAPDLWPLFDALAGVPLACIRGANSDLLSAETFAEMQRRRTDMIVADVPDRGHVPFLDEPEALEALNEWTMLI